MNICQKCGGRGSWTPAASREFGGGREKTHIHMGGQGGRTRDAIYPETDAPTDWLKKKLKFVREQGSTKTRKGVKKKRKEIQFQKKTSKVEN